MLRVWVAEKILHITRIRYRYLGLPKTGEKLLSSFFFKKAYTLIISIEGGEYHFCGRQRGVMSQWQSCF